MNSPSDPQCDLMRQVVEYGGDFAPIFSAQFASSRTAREEHCEECFSLEVIGDVPLLPADAECPLCFDAETSDGGGAENALQVLLWHENGRISAVEISSVTDPHPAVSDLRILVFR